MTPIGVRGHDTGGLFHANQIAAFDYSESQTAFAARVMDCIRRAFDAIGARSATQEIIFSKLQSTRNLGRDEIIDKPMEFIEGLEAILGEAAVVVFGYMFTRQVKREFSLIATFDKEPIKARDLVDLLRMAAYAALESNVKILDQTK